MTGASIVIPSRGGAERLPRLLDALGRQTFGDWEAIVVIDGDVDGSADVVARYSHLPVRAIVFPENRGRVSALNAGLDDARGDVLIRCDDDLEPAPDYVESHVRHHASAEVGVVGLCINQLPDNRYARVYGNHADALHRRGAYAAAPDQRWRYWAGNCSIGRAVWNRVGPYDTRYRAYGWEDVDYGYRLHQHGIPIILDAALETPHYAAAVTTLTRSRRAFLSGQARRLFDQIHGADTSGPLTLAASPWNKLVGFTAGRLNHQRVERLARAVDLGIYVVPIIAARKLIALCVESSSIAGRSYPQNTPDDPRSTPAAA